MLRNDLRFAVRSLVRRPGLTGAIVATLALAIGANATIFSLVNSLFFGSLPVADADRLVEVYGSSDRDANVGGFQGFLPISHPNFEDVRERTTSLTGAYAYTMWPVSIELGDEPERSQAMYVSGEYFDVLGVEPFLGRVFSAEEDDTPGAAPYAVVSHALWTERLGGRPDAVGRTFRLNTRSYTIIGVAPPGFRGTSSTLGTDIWLPVSMIVDVPTWGDLWENRGARFFFMGGRLADGREPAQAEQELKAVWTSLAEEYPRLNGTSSLQLLPLLEARVNPNVRGVIGSASAVLMAVVGVLLLIACMNVANLLLARALSRGREMAIRASIGAGRGRLVRQMVTESTVLFGIGGLAGLGVAMWGQANLTGIQPPALFGATLDVRTDVRVIAFTAAVTIGCGALFGLIPAWRASRTDVATQLRNGDRRSGSRDGHALRNALVAGQLCLSLVALIGAGLFLRALGEANDVALGFEPDDLVLLSVDLGAQGFDEAEGQTFYREAVETLEGVPGVRSAAVGSLRPLTFGPLRSVMRIDQDPNDPEAGRMVREELVSPGYRETVGAGLSSGRDLATSDVAGGPAVALVNERMAEVFWPGSDPIGQQFFIQLPPTEVTVVGVFETGKYTSVSEDPTPAFLRPVEQAYAPSVTFFVRVQPGAASTIEEARRALQALDPSLPVFDVEPAQAVVSLATWNTRAVTILLAAFGLLGLLLAAVGVFGVVSTTVRERTREIGLRMALGAEASEMILVVVRSTLAIAGTGVVAGLGLAAVLTRPLDAQLFGVSSTDLFTYATTAVLLLAVAALAAFLPARRAARVHPTEALRSE